VKIPDKTNIQGFTNNKNHLQLKYLTIKKIVTFSTNTVFCVQFFVIDTKRDKSICYLPMDSIKTLNDSENLTAF
jgi:hypothetical protein